MHVVARMKRLRITIQALSTTMEVARMMCRVVRTTRHATTKLLQPRTTARALKMTSAEFAAVTASRKALATAKETR